MAAQCPQLQSLNIGLVYKYNDSGMESLAHHCSDIAVLALARHCPLLQDLNINHCRLITDLSINEIALRCKELISLNAQGCPLITTAAQLNVVQQCQKLQILRVTGGSPEERAKFVAMMRATYPHVKI